MEGLGTEVEDLVCLKETGQLGIVDHVGGRSDDESDYDDSEDGVEDEEDGGDPWTEEMWEDVDGANIREAGEGEVDMDGIERQDVPEVPPDFALVTLIENGAQAVCKVEDLDVIDRRFVLGDIVSDSADGDRQSAVVCGIHLDLTAVHLVGDEYEGEEFEVDSRRLQFIGGLREGCLVIKDNWLGRVTHFLEEVTVEFPDGAIGVIQNAPSRIMPSHSGAGFPDRDGRFYPGQCVALSGTFWCHTAWIRGRSRQRQGRVKSLNISEVRVNWLATKPTLKGGTDSDAVDMPSERCLGADLIPLNAYRYTWWRTGDRAILPTGEPSPQGETAIASDPRQASKQTQELETGDAGVKDAIPKDRHPEARSEKRRRGKFTTAHRKRSQLLASDQSSSADANGDKYNRNVVEVVSSTTKIDVLWQDGTRTYRIPATRLVPVRHLDSYDFFPGHFVTHVADPNDPSAAARKGVVHSVSQDDRTARVVWQKKDGSGFVEVDQDISVYDLSFNSDYDLHIGDVVVRIFSGVEESDDAWAGEVVNTGIGTVEVDWNDGSRSQIAPESLIVLYKDELDGYDDGDSMSMDVSISSLQSGSDPYAQRSYVEEEYDHDVPMESVDMEGADREEPPEEATLAHSTAVQPQDVDSVPVEVVAPRIPGSDAGSKGADVETEDSAGQQTNAGSEVAAGEQPQPTIANGSPRGARDCDGQAAPPGTEEGELSQPSHVPEDVLDLEQFSVLEDEPVGHHYLNSPRTNHRLAVTVRKEWQRLASSTPPSLYVRAYESRLDLLRVGIIGSKDTPYEDCLFFFDLQLPEDYPNKPPKVFFHSHGRRLNPNLYEDGKVCLSILGTWSGDKVEQWDPATSNLLRVLLSLQAIVLTEEPYYNEAGYEKQAGSAEGKNKSKLYNESAMLLTLRHAMSTCSPNGHPPEFSELVSAHFRRRKHQIIARCRSILENSEHSVGFRKSLQDVIPRLEKLTPS